MTKINLLTEENISTKMLKFDKSQFEEIGQVVIKNIRPKYAYINQEKTDEIECYQASILPKNTYDILVKSNIPINSLKETTIKISLHSKNIDSIIGNDINFVELTNYSVVPKWNAKGGWATCEIVVEEFKVLSNNA